MSETPKPNYALRRLTAATLAGVTLVGGHAAAEHVVHAIDNHAEANKKKDAVVAHFSTLNLAESYEDKTKKMPDAGDVVLYTIEPGDKPDNIANAFDSPDPKTLSEEISGQFGGAGKLQQGAEAVMPKDELGNYNYVIDGMTHINDIPLVVPHEVK